MRFSSLFPMPACTCSLFSAVMKNPKSLFEGAHTLRIVKAPAPRRSNPSNSKGAKPGKKLGGLMGFVQVVAQRRHRLLRR